MKTIAIIYGWAEGSWQSKRLRKNLLRNGFQIAKNAASADIVITHSFGCYLAPEKLNAKLVVLINPAYWPRRSLATSTIKKQKEDLLNTHRHSGLIWWASKLLYNGWYILSRPLVSYYVATRHDVKNIPRPKLGRRVLIIRNLMDTFCPPNIKELLKDTGDYTLVKLPGGHDDCWMSPGPYVDLLLKEL